MEGQRNSLFVKAKVRHLLKWGKKIKRISVKLRFHEIERLWETKLQIQRDESKNSPLEEEPDFAELRAPRAMKQMCTTSVLIRKRDMTANWE